MSAFDLITDLVDLLHVHIHVHCVVYSCVGMECIHTVSVLCTHTTLHVFTLQNPSQKVVQKLAAEVWSAIPPDEKTVETSWKYFVDQLQPRVFEMARAIIQ